MKVPGPDHPITVTANPNRVQVRFNGRIIAESTRTLTLRESTYPAVIYIPREDAHMELFERSSHMTRCPYKGEASYYSLRVGDRLAKDAVWSYEHPYPAVADITGKLAFYPDRVDGIGELPPKG